MGIKDVLERIMKYRAAIDHLKAGELSYLHLVYEVFAYDEASLMKEAGDVCNRINLHIHSLHHVWAYSPFWSGS